MNYTKTICAAALLCSVFTINNASITNSALQGLVKGIELDGPYNPLDWIPFITWWYSPAVATGLHGIENIADLVIGSEQSDTINQKEHSRYAYVTGYTAGNALRILMYAIPIIMIDSFRLRSYLASPYDHFNSPEQKIVPKIQSTIVWGLRAMMLPFIIQLLQSGCALTR